MSYYISNATPLVIDYGTQDLSPKTSPQPQDAVPSHCPKFYLYAQKGEGSHLVSGAEAQLMFGEETFKENGKYANHSTVFANGCFQKANNVVVERVVPADAGPKANVTLWLDVLETTVDLYERTTDGAIKLNSVTGLPIVTGTTTGFKVFWTATEESTHSGFDNIGRRVKVQGSQTGPNGEVSQRYPIHERVVSGVGEYGNNRGVRFWAPTSKDIILPTKLMAEERVYPFYLNVIKRSNRLGNVTFVDNVYKERNTMFVLKPGTLDPLSDKALYLGKVGLDDYRNIKDSRYEITYGDFGKMVIYQNNIDELLGMFHAAETDFIDEWSDFTESEEDIYLFNPFSGTSSSDVPYHTFQIVDDVDSTRLTNYTNVWAGGGSDGTMSNSLHAVLVKDAVERYGDPTDNIQNAVVNVENIMYDTGFPLETKFAMANFIAYRKDTIVVWGTQQVDEVNLTPSQELSVAIALKTRAQMFPESDYFGTPTMRAVIMGGSGTINDSSYSARVPTTYHLMRKAAAYMGASNGKWKSEFSFGQGGKNRIEDMSDVDSIWVPPATRVRFWDAGINWPLDFNRNGKFFPANKTVYDEDTSVLNSFPVVVAISNLNRIAHLAWQTYVGDDELTIGQFTDRINEFVTNQARDRFAGKYIIVPVANFTEDDKTRGYSWELPIKIYAPMMKTQMRTSVQAYRIEDYTA